MVSLLVSFCSQSVIESELLKVITAHSPSLSHGDSSQGVFFNCFFSSESELIFIYICIACEGSDLLEEMLS